MFSISQSYYFFVSWDALINVLPNIIINLNLIKLNATDSTNTYLKQLVRETSIPDETVVITQNQLKGRGQMGNGWRSETGQSLTFSMFKRFDGLMGERQFMISMAVSLAIAEALKNIDIPNISIKWPNDILSANKKIGGVLIENVMEGSFIRYAIIGIGINVNECSFPGLAQASSLKFQTGATFDLDEVLKTITQSVFAELRDLGIQDFLSLKSRYESNLFRKGKVSVFENGEGGRFNGIIKGISDIGELVMEPEDEPIQKFQMKQVKLIY